jgi:hypothetical protein
LNFFKQVKTSAPRHNFGVNKSYYLLVIVFEAKLEIGRFVEYINDLDFFQDNFASFSNACFLLIFLFTNIFKNV